MSETANIPARIKLARKMAGLETQASLVEAIPGWKPSRVGNYEAGVSVPGPDDMLLIAKATGSSPCWLMFGLGPIRPNARDQQAIRHQNLTRLVEQAQQNGGLAALAKSLRIAQKLLDEHLDNPFLPIDDTLARRCERITKRRKGWMDEQHIEDDPLCMAFPEDMRELMMLYSGLLPAQRGLVLETVRTLVQQLEGLPAKE
ncbi:MAG TPA: helix-turn-helix transcriptional regulator [Gammaproteobacteria bacterium]|jgi:transcriptional regulator with XRE-family HTH domain